MIILFFYLLISCGLTLIVLSLNKDGSIKTSEFISLLLFSPIAIVCVTIGKLVKKR
jgi:hypothetical protein